jgi:hypothetical protein
LSARVGEGFIDLAIRLKLILSALFFDEYLNNKNLLLKIIRNVSHNQVISMKARLSISEMLSLIMQF